ncbi:hypothetical protein EV694_1708 [Volucribacter psittacicida]|uniref:Anti-CBASS protein Acb1-like N-terminal domain-containing protein n=1 Tax=Volucribacter psittacicida TaxID=203482 RepID=A0A4R1FMD9_9PAST|nr:DUF1073 domain-containing protein [Volucribacter psittacicida]TCJ96156.1 hypothetical protein EV694_1708 [Volucribacter psittacicida]
MFKLFKRNNQVQENKESKKASFWSSERFVDDLENNFFIEQLNRIVLSNNRLTGNSGNIATDSDNQSLKMNLVAPDTISVAIANWFAAHSFIGYQMCALLAQNWLINKACSIPARDATRNGYDIISTDGSEIPDDIIKALQKYDKQYRLRWNCEQFVRMGRIFGIRLALFDIESDDPEFYEKPFNLDGVTKGSYKGIIQIDPYWCIPMLVGEELSNPASQNFYEPTYWQINGKKYHRSHLIIFRNSEVPDLLKPVYLYGGLPVPQLIMERVYGAERTASESLGLVTSKRTTVWLTNMAMFAADAENNSQKLKQWVSYRDNYGVKVGDKDGDQLQQFDTALGDLDEVIMTNYQLVAAASNVPATKLLGTTPKGFNSTGEGEAKNYHEELESIQEHDLTELVERHHQLVIKSCGLESIETTINWRPVDSPTAQELAERNKLKADTYSALVMCGAIDGADVRYRLASDPDSGFHDMGEQDNEHKLLEELGLTEDVIHSINELERGNDEKV